MKRILLLCFMFVTFTSGYVMAQDRTVSGKVTSADDGSPLPGVNVILKGTSTGVTTDIDGNYKVNVPSDGGVLVFSFIGMASIEQTIGARSVLDVSMSTDITQLSEVVVVGYGELDKRKLTSSIVSISGEDIASMPVPSFDQGLQGRASGVQITVPSGILGQAPRIRIRGTNSISSGSQPLIVLDGVPMLSGNASGVAQNNLLGDINPDDIQSFEVLKDGAATAIYGSRAANGVILITTKSGKSGETRVDYNMFAGVNQVASRFNLLDADQFVAIQNEKLASRGISPQAFPGDNNENTDWQDVIFRNGRVQSHALSVNGGSQDTKYFLSLSHMDQEGAVVRNSLQRTSVRANLDYSGVKWLDLGAKLGVTQTINQGLNAGANSLSGNVLNATRSFPNVSPYNEDDPSGFNISPDGTQQARGNNLLPIAFNLPNIGYALENNIFEAKNFRTMANAYAQINIADGLKFRTQLGVDNIENKDRQALDGRHGDGRSVGGLVFRGSFNVQRWNLQNFLSYDKTFGDMHTVSVVVGVEHQKERSDFFWGQGLTFSVPFFLQEGLITGSYETQNSGGSVVETGFQSYFGRINYDYGNKYLVSLSARNDAISQLPVDTRQGTFLGASLGWNIAEEDFFNVDFLNSFKMRASLAQTGNVNIGAFPYLGTYGAALYGSQTALWFTQVGNPGLRWETSTKYNVGVDFAILNERVFGSFDYYRNDMTDLILQAPTPPTLGIPNNQIAQNVGALYNDGIEFSVNTLNVSRGDFQWTSTFNFTTNRNEITALNNDEDIVFDYHINRVGHPVGSFFGFKYMGVNSANGNPMYEKADGTVIQGNPDNNTYYVYDPANPTALTETTTLGQGDRQILGNSNPTYFGGFGNTIRYKGLDFELFLVYSGGNSVYNITRADLLGMEFSNNGAEILNRWTPANTDTDVPRLSYANGNFLNLSGQMNSRFLERGDFLRVQNISLGYNVSKNALNSIGLQTIRKVRVYAQVQNAFVFTNYKGLDPELTGAATGNSVFGIDQNTNPLLRTFTAGLNIGI